MGHGWNFVAEVKTHQSNAGHDQQAPLETQKTELMPATMCHDEGQRPASIDSDPLNQDNIASSSATKTLRDASRNYIGALDARVNQLSQIHQVLQLLPDPLPPAKPRDFGCFAQAITKDVAGKLQTDGYAVVDNIFGADWSNALRNEMKWLSTADLLQPNETQFTTKDLDGNLLPQRFTKPNIYELDLHAESARKLVPEFDQLFERFSVHHAELVHALHQYCPELELDPRASATTIKLQHNAGNGGCFPLHYDNPGRPNNRRITCLVYLNPDWKSGDGGELQLLPFCDKEVVIEPLFDRMVLFRADRILHGVKAAAKERFCFTIWIDAEIQTNDDANVLLKQKHIKEALDNPIEHVVRLFRNSGLQRVLSRGLYKEIYESSLRACQGRGAPCMIESHRHIVDSAQANETLSILIDKLRKYDQEQNNKSRLILQADSSTAGL